MKNSTINGSLQRETSSHRLLLFPLPFQGHINPMLQLANIFHSKGFQISIVHTRFNYPDTSKHPHFTFHRIEDGLSEAEASSEDSVYVMKHLLLDRVETIRESLAKFLSEDKYGRDSSSVCLVTDVLWHFTQSVADDLKIPRFVLRTSSVCSYIAFNMFPLLKQRGYLDDMETKLENAVDELPPLKVKDIAMLHLPKINTEDLQCILANMLESSKESSGLIFNTFKELEEHDVTKLHDEFHYRVPTFTIGPFHKLFSAASSSLRAQDQSAMSWLDKQQPRSVVYVSFGSAALMDEKKLHEVAWGLANSKQPFLWVLRPGMVRGSDRWLELLPGGFLDEVRERSCIVKWAPQQEVLSHASVGGFFTHNGWNSTLESVCEGVPMICLPFFGDQMVNARYVSDVWRVGIRLEEGIERGAIEEAVVKLMKGSEGEEMKCRVMELKEKADLCLGSSGSSTRAIDGLVELIMSFKIKSED